MQYIAVKIDVVRSRGVANRQKLQDNIFAAVATVNERYVDKLASQFAVTHGDEVQGMLTATHVDACLPICEHFVDGLQPQSVRIGMGLGSLATKVQPIAIGMDGDAWHRAQSAIERARRTRAAFSFEGPDESMDEDVNAEDINAKDINAIVNFLLSHRLGWTDNQREAVLLLNALGSQQAVASRLQISKAAVSQRLSGCLWDKYEALRETAQRQLVRYARQVMHLLHANGTDA